jgi:pyruvate formate lyase activating enzyme
MLWESRCIRCGACVSTCTVEAISGNGDGDALHYVTDRDICTVCGSCAEACAAGAREMIGRRMTVSEVMADIARDAIFFEESGGGVTFSGGEPLSQRAFLAELLKAWKELEIHTAVDTSGYTPWKALDSIRGNTDLFLYDLKLMDDARHRQFTGAPNGLILHNLRALSERGHRIIIRVPVIPGINDDAANLHALAEFAADLPHLERVDLLPYHASAQGKYERLGKPYHLPGAVTPPDERMGEIKDLLEQHDLNVTIGG